jgi:hydroxymethylbilane synthase
LSVSTTMKNNLVIATRRSPLALRQTELVKDHLLNTLKGVTFEILEMVTTGDQKREISLEKEGGKGLFTKEIEDALLDNRADLAVHSAKDLPTETPKGLVFAGFLKREDPADVLVLRQGFSNPNIVATGSPRRRAQLQRIFPNVHFIDFRGNVETRLEKIARGDADATVLAAAGLNRLGISGYDKLIFKTLPIEEMVPAVGQGAIAIQCRESDFDKFSNLFDEETRYAVEIERCFLSGLGGGCHAAFAAYYNNGTLYVFHENVGYQIFKMNLGLNRDQIQKSMDSIIEELNNG